MHEQPATQSSELDRLDRDAEHVMPQELATQDSALEDSVGQLSRVQSKLVDTLHALQLLPPHLVKDHNRAVRAIQEALTLVGDTDDSEAIGPIDWVKFGERLQKRRTAAGLTQEWLADRVGVTSTTIRQLEHHTRRARRSLRSDPGCSRRLPRSKNTARGCSWSPSATGWHATSSLPR